MGQDANWESWLRGVCAGVIRPSCLQTSIVAANAIQPRTAAVLTACVLTDTNHSTPMLLCAGNAKYDPTCQRQHLLSVDGHPPVRGVRGGVHLTS